SFFQAEDGIRGKLVTGVQTCALPIWLGRLRTHVGRAAMAATANIPTQMYIDGAWRDAEGAATLEVINPADESSIAGVAYGGRAEIGRASCRERGEHAAGVVALKHTKT